ncbi:MAG: hypothetical protein V4864_25175 [Pseudomonadota bacterium]
MILPWLAVAALGALHGLNPASGWLPAAACGLRSRDRSQALRALLPIAFGHAASVALVGAAVVLGLSMDRTAVQSAAGGLLAAVVVFHLAGRKAGRKTGRARAPAGRAGHAGLALWSFMVSTGHGAGLMLVPALVPLCMDGGPAGGAAAPDGLALALAAIGVHTAAMLAVTGTIAAGVCRLPASVLTLGPSLFAAANRHWRTHTSKAPP